MELSKNRRQTIYERALREQEEARWAHNNVMNEHADITREFYDAYNKVDEAQHDLDTFGETEELLEAYHTAEVEWQHALEVYEDAVGDSANILKGKTHMAAIAYEAYIA